MREMTWTYGLLEYIEFNLMVHVIKTRGQDGTKLFYYVKS